eukprot:403362637
MEASGIKRLFYQKVRDFIYHIPAENPSLFTLCGTNCYVVGQGTNRVMIEAGDYPERNQLFLENFKKFLYDQQHVNIDRILITHSHYDHFGGLFDILNIIQNRQQLGLGKTQINEPMIHKKLDGNQFEKEVFLKYPSLEGKVQDLTHGEVFDIDDEFELKSLFTPGHASDHFSFLLSEKNKSIDFTKKAENSKRNENYLFSGDIILGTPSTSVSELTDYMNSLYQLRKQDFSHICLPHSIDMNLDSVIVNGKDKLEEYIKYREDRDKAILSCFQDGDKITKDELYSVIYGPRNLLGGLQIAAMNNLELHLNGLVKREILQQSTCKVNGHEFYHKNEAKM